MNRGILTVRRVFNTELAFPLQSCLHEGTVGTYLGKWLLLHHLVFSHHDLGAQVQSSLERNEIVLKSAALEHCTCLLRRSWCGCSCINSVLMQPDLEVKFPYEEWKQKQQCPWKKTEWDQVESDMQGGCEWTRTEFFSTGFIQTHVHFVFKTSRCGDGTWILPQLGKK